MMLGCQPRVKINICTPLSCRQSSDFPMKDLDLGSVDDGQSVPGFGGQLCSVVCGQQLCSVVSRGRVMADADGEA